MPSAKYLSFFSGFSMLSHNFFPIQLYSISMSECKKDITPLLTHWGYVFLALTHRIGLYLKFLEGNSHMRSLNGIPSQIPVHIPTHTISAGINANISHQRHSEGSACPLNILSVTMDDPWCYKSLWLIYIFSTSKGKKNWMIMNQLLECYKLVMQMFIMYPSRYRGATLCNKWD